VVAAAPSVIERIEPEFRPKSRGLWAQGLNRLVRNRLAVGAGAVLTVLIVLAILTAAIPAVENHEPTAQQFEVVQSGPTSDYYLGTDNLGRDLWARVWEGLRISLRIGFGTQVVAVTIGLLIGASAALGGRFTDNLLMRFVDVTYAFPDLLAIILMRAILSERDWPIIGSGNPQIPGLSGELLQVILAISLVSWVTIARLVRGQMLSLKETDYVLAARSMGASTRRIVFVHMLPNTLGPVIVAVTFGIPLAINAEAILALIGFGLQPPTASLGTLILDGYTYYRANNWAIIVPAVAIATLMLCFTFLGDGLRDALDPRTKR
jgi:oligopeptide transport system permease protein